MRFGIAGLLGLVVPGSGHLFAGRRREAMIFLVPTAAIVGWFAGTTVAVGSTGILALVVSPGVLPVLAFLNVVIALVRTIAVLDGAHSEPRTRRSLAVVAGGLAVLVVAPHLVAGRLIASTSAVARAGSGPSVPRRRPVQEPRLHDRSPWRARRSPGMAIGRPPGAAPC